MSHHIGEPAPHEPGDDDDSYPPACSNPGGHFWVISEKNNRCYCEYCLADGDA